MIERYSGAGRFTANNDGQWVSYEQHEKRMRTLLGALRMVISRASKDYAGFFSQQECDELDSAFYEYSDEIRGMTYPGKEG